MRIRRRGVEPTGYDAASVDAVTAMSSFAQSGTAVVDGLALVVAEVDGFADVALVDGDAVFDGVPETLVLGVVDADGVPEESGVPDPPNVRWKTHRTPRSRATTTSSASRRRTQ
jgi:hypothetical protein